jgi:hypothetical protein
MNCRTKEIVIGRVKALASRSRFRLPKIQMLLEYSRFGTWVREEATCGTVRCSSRSELYQFIVRGLLCDRAFDLLEFGVFQGASMRLWISASDNPETRFVGFDGFEGLPETWSHLTFTDSCGRFDTNGEIPEVNDARVRFEKGWFQETLPVFMQTFQASRQLVIHLDADLYSSTLFVLTSLAPHITPGTVLVFDEFSSTSTCEFRAFMDYASAYRCRYRLVAHSGEFYDQVCLQVTR